MSNENEVSLGHASLSHIGSNLDRIFGKDKWVTWEMETISDELKIAFDDLTRDKIQVLQIIRTHPEKFFEDMAFFLYATEVINNKVADFDYMPLPTSLEFAYAIEEAKKLGLPVDAVLTPNSDITDVMAYILREEGYSEPVYPFTFVPVSRLEPGQTPEDTEAKKRAIEIYIKDMGGL